MCGKIGRVCDVEGHGRVPSRGAGPSRGQHPPALSRRHSRDLGCLRRSGRGQGRNPQGVSCVLLCRPDGGLFQSERGLQWGRLLWPRLQGIEWARGESKREGPRGQAGTASSCPSVGGLLEHWSGETRGGGLLGAGGLRPHLGLACSAGGLGQFSSLWASATPAGNRSARTSSTSLYCPWARASCWGWRRGELAALAESGGQPWPLCGHCSGGPGLDLTRSLRGGLPAPRLSQRDSRRHPAPPVLPPADPRPGSHLPLTEAPGQPVPGHQSPAAPISRVSRATSPRPCSLLLCPPSNIGPLPDLVS